MEEVETACLFEYGLRFQRMLSSEECSILSKHKSKKSKTATISSFFKVLLKTKNLSKMPHIVDGSRRENVQN